MDAVLTELDDIFTSKGEQSMTFKTFLSGQHVCGLLLTGFGMTFDKKHSALTARHGPVMRG